MRSSERRPLAFEKQHPREDRVLNLVIEFVEFGSNSSAKETVQGIRSSCLGSYIACRH